MAEIVYFPKVGMTMEDGILGRWHVPDGATVTKGQPLFELETEKVTMDVEADGDGLLKQFYAAGVVLKPGDIAGCLLAAGEAVPQAILDRVAAQGGGAPAAPAPEGEAATASAPETAIPAPAAPAGGMLRVSPVAKRLAAEHDIDLATLKGSGPDGRIVEQDVRRAIEAAAASAAAPAPVAPPTPAPTPAPGATTIPYAGRRKTIGERMHQGLATMAQLTLVSEASVGEAMKMLHGLNREWRKAGVAVTLTSLIARASTLALLEHPRLNSRIEGDQIVLLPAVGLGIAVDLDDSLMVPVIHGAESLSLKELAGQIRALAEKTKENKLTPDDVTGGTFTVTSLEGSGVDAFTPLINPPQAAILGVGRVRDVAAFEGDRVVRAQVTTLSLTFDHRVVDGAPAARFLDRVVELLGRPYLLM